MSARRAALLAGAVALGAALPAHAATYPVCHAELVDAAAGAASTCTTGAPGATGSSGGFHRLVTLEVAQGSATATLHCYTAYRSWTGSVTVTGPGVDYVGTSDDQRCDVTLTALSAGTTATATSTTSYYIHWE